MKVCRLCGRVLKKNESQIRGFGLVCYKKYLASKSNKLFNLTNKK